MMNEFGMLDSEELEVDPNQYLTFMLSGEVYAINILSIREIIEFGEVTSVPMMPDFIAGVINLRGSVVPVVGLAERFDHEVNDVTKRTSIVVIELHDEEGVIETGIIVDEVNAVIEIKPEDIESAPDFGAKIRTDFISGMGKVSGKFIVILDVDHVLNIDELSAVSAILGGSAE